MHAARVRSASEIPARRRRDPALDVAKGFAILLVVLGQCLSGLLAQSFFPPDVLWPALAVYVLYSFAVPLFFVVSGVLAAARHLPAGESLQRALARLAWPYLLWAALQWGLAWHRSGADRSLLPQALRILWMPVTPYWFLYALFFCQMLYLLTRAKKPLTQVVIAVLLFVAPLFFETIVLRLTLGVVFQVARGFLFFTLGAVTAGPIRQLGRWAAVVATLLFAALAVGYYQVQITGPLGPMLMVPVSVAGMVAVLGWSRSLAESRLALAAAVTAAVGILGRYSMSIYVMHIFFTAAVRFALHRLALPPARWVTAAEILAALAAGTLGPLAINWIASKTNAHRWLGLQPMETAAARYR